MQGTVRTRFAPSPTGNLHIGSVRTALFSWLYAKHHNGKCILRIEDTDQARSSPESIQKILFGLSWLGLEYDEGPYYQTQRAAHYQTALQKLLDTDHAYYCYCSQETIDQMRAEAMAKGEKPRYDGRCRDKPAINDSTVKPVIRFKNPQHGAVVVADHIQGEVSYQNAELDDLIIARSNGMPTYNLVVVVDDIDMQITDIIRGDDHLNNTPRQINIFQALGASIPNYAHLPLILGADKRRLSKRHGATNILEYKEQGYLPEAMLNYLVRLGWSHGDQEIFSIAEMVKYFDIKDINKSAALIDAKKLLWLNQQHIKETDSTILANRLNGMFSQLNIDTKDGVDILQLVEVQKKRAKTMLEMAQQSQFFYCDFDINAAEAAKKHLYQEILMPLQSIGKKLALLEQWTDENLHQIIIDTAIEFNIKSGKISQPLRVAVTGGIVSPSIDSTLRLIGKNKVLQRLDAALEYIVRHA